MPKFKAIAAVGRPGTRVKYHCRVVFNFFPFFVTQNFAHFPRPNHKNLLIFTLFDSLDVNPRLLHFYRDKTVKKKFPVTPILSQKNSPKRGVNGRFQAKLAKY